MNALGHATAGHAERYPVGPAVVPHRKNAAEWVMWIALRPLVPVARLIERLRARKDHRHG